MTAMEEDVDDRFAGIDIDSLLNRAEKRSFNYGRKKTLYEAPEFIQRLNGEETVMEGQSLCIECKVAGFPAPTLRWYKDDEEIVDHGRIHIESNGRGGYCLIIDNVNKGDEAAYRCRAENVEGASSSRFFLSVKSKPKSPKKKDAKSSPNRRTVSFPPMFATIVEKVEEEEKQGIELAKLPPSPMTEFYYALTLKSRQSWPTFLGDWAFANSPEKRRTDPEYRQVQSEPATPVSTGRKQRFVGQNGNAELSESKKQRMTEETKLKIEKENERLKKLEEEKMKREAERKMDEERKRREEAMSLRKKAREERRRRENVDAEIGKSKAVDVVENNVEMKDEEKDKDKSTKQEQEKSVGEQMIKNKVTKQEETKTHHTTHQESVNKDIDHKKQENAQKTVKHSNSDHSATHQGNKTTDLGNKITDQSKTEPAPDRVVPKKSVLQKFAKHLEPTETKPEPTDKRGPQIFKGVHDKFNKTSEVPNKTCDSVNKTTVKVDNTNKQATANNTANKTSLKGDTANKTDTKNETLNKTSLKGDTANKTVHKTEPTGTKTAQTPDKTNKTSGIQDKINQIAPGNGKNPLTVDKFSKTTPAEDKSVKSTPNKPNTSSVQSKSATTSTDKTNLKDSNKTNNSVSQNAAHIPTENKQNKEASKPTENNKFTSLLQTKDQQKNSQEQKQIDALKQKEKSQLDALKEREKSQLDSLRQKEKTQIDALRQREKNQIDALRQREKDQIEALRQREKNQRDALRQSEKDKIEEKDKKQNDTLTNKVQRTFTPYGSKSAVPEKNDDKIKKEQKEKEEKQKEELRLKEEKQKEELREKEKKQREELRNKEQKQKDTLKEKEEKQKEELRLKEIKMREDLRRHQEEEERRRENKKEQLRQEQLMRQYEEENKRRMERLREEAKLKEANKDDVNNDEEVKVYKRDYSFSELRQSLEAHLGGDVMSAEEHKYWDDILEKHAYSISDIKKAFDKMAEERPARSKTRRNSVEETDLALIKRSSSISDLKDSYTNSLGRPKKKTTETAKRQKDEEFLKRAASISDLRQQFLEEVKKQSSPAKLLSVPGKQEAEITIRNLKISDSLKPSEVRQRSKSPTPTPLYTPPQQSNDVKPLTRNQSELTKLAGTVASKRASFHEMLSQRTQPDTSLAQKRLSYQSRDAYGSRDIPVYRRAAGWSDDVDKLQKPTTSTDADQNQPSLLKQSKPEKSEPSSVNQDSDKTETTAGNVRPFVYNSTRTTARRFIKKD